AQPFKATLDRHRQLRRAYRHAGHECRADLTLPDQLRHGQGNAGARPGEPGNAAGWLSRPRKARNMAIKFSCEHCDTELTVRDELAGKAARCPHCKGVITPPRRGGNGASGIRAKNRREDEDEWEDEEDEERPRKAKK